ncbi:DUF262 domain-containing protein [Mucilaginibacter sp. 14171R-50]|uniref:DUF262 domain-containing protein n=1 Tax=Mucilaginibacter sp. 14171R-50 TaxID=2703789 RepID=UPI00138C4F2B|nr:DUF262 domain-containing protein [Mucilaginibacter sp. 14171R-50]QHS56805.1 DUF262 domain-containing protein [Mucilaginibacter sp. 14171R-50]
MEQPSEAIEALTIRQLLGNGEQYMIPIYQRKYAWEAKEIEQLVQDIADYATGHGQENYFIGTMVVAIDPNLPGHVQVVDGQQRLTTLSIMAASIRNGWKEIEKNWLTAVNITYASRISAKTSLLDAFNGHFPSEEQDDQIKAAYYICREEIRKKLSEKNISIESFTSCLFDRVQLLRVPLPQGIDLNHYFEIMNSRGEQLEKQEILKARLMKYFVSLEPKQCRRYQYAFHKVWESCENMERYVHYGFSTDERSAIFDEANWMDLRIRNFDDLVSSLVHKERDAERDEEMSIDDILRAPLLVEKKKQDEEAPERFNTVINFQNFLLHVLRVQMRSTSVSLDDKQLIDMFDEVLSKEPDQALSFVKEFAFNLLKCKLLFDRYVIKREFTGGTDRWSLKTLKRYETKANRNGVKYINTFGEEDDAGFESVNQRVIMLLSMFHVSVPSMVYKYWFNAVLDYLFYTTEIESKPYIYYMERVAEAFVFDRFLAEKPKEYHELLKPGVMLAAERDESGLNLSKLRYTNLQNNLIFNYLDYLIWMREKTHRKDERVSKFAFTFRSSVEHFYPQHPINPQIPKLNDHYLHAFGNLCLISHEKNSRLSNYMPDAKKSHYIKSAIDSMKQFLMMDYTEWEEKDIDHHEADVTGLLLDQLTRPRQQGIPISTDVVEISTSKMEA